jgi:hypothetical protein
MRLGRRRHDPGHFLAARGDDEMGTLAGLLQITGQVLAELTEVDRLLISAGRRSS